MVEDNDDFEMNQPELKRPVSENMNIMMMTGYAQQEIVDQSGSITKVKFPRVELLVKRLELHGHDYPFFKIYQEEKKKLDQMYGNPDERDWEMYPVEAKRRFQLAQELGEKIGTYMIDSRYVNAQPLPEDEIIFSPFWDEQE